MFESRLVWLFPIGLFVILCIFLFLPFCVTLDSADASGRLTQWGNYGQAFGAIAAMFGWCAVFLSLQTAHGAGKQAVEARSQTAAMIKALNNQAEISGISTRLDYLMSIRNGPMTHDLHRQLMEEIRQLNIRLARLLDPAAQDAIPNRD